MAILPILEAPHPILSKVAKPVTEEQFGEELVQLINDMVDTMYDAPGVGLAAPQVGHSLQVLVADPGNEEGKSERKLYRIVNPVILEKSKETISYEESCLSVPAFYLMTKRYKRILLQWQDGMGNIHQEHFEGFPSILLQHEMDHLRGITLLDRSSRFKKSRYINRRKKARKR